jgi:hypothetical protein
MIAQIMIYPQVLITKTPYNADFVSELKSSIPSGLREWNPIEKVWLVDPELKDLVIELLTRHYEKVLVFDERKGIREILEREISKEVEEEIEEILEKEGF